LIPFLIDTIDIANPFRVEICLMGGSIAVLHGIAGTPAPYSY
jgi:hypothetical protein